MTNWGHLVIIEDNSNPGSFTEYLTQALFAADSLLRRCLKALLGLENGFQLIYLSLELSTFLFIQFFLHEPVLLIEERLKVLALFSDCLNLLYLIVYLNLFFFYSFLYLSKPRLEVIFEVQHKHRHALMLELLQLHL